MENGFVSCVYFNFDHLHVCVLNLFSRKGKNSVMVSIGTYEYRNVGTFSSLKWVFCVLNNMFKRIR